MSILVGVIFEKNLLQNISKRSGFDIEKQTHVYSSIEKKSNE